MAALIERQVSEVTDSTEKSAPQAGRTGSAYPLGATLRSNGTNFSLFSTHATSVELLFFDHADSTQASEVISLDPVHNRTSHYWHTFVSEIKSGQIYGYRVHGPEDPSSGLRFDSRKVLLDPYARGVVTGNYNRAAACLPGDNLATCMKSVVVDLSAFGWEGDRPLNRSFPQTVIYEMHVAGFTRNPNSGVTDSKRGTYLGVIEKIPYLQQLGITAVELLPVFQFDAQDAPKGLTNYWGYSPVSFFAPHLAYATVSDPIVCVDEFRTMVKALHRAGIEVILDVVYNHTAEGDEHGPTFCFRGLENSFYYILNENKTTYANYAGVGNTLRANHSIVKRLITDSLIYWASEMHVDGFRFDLASIFSRGESGQPTSNAPIIWDIDSHPALAGTKLIAEPWDTAGLYQVGSFGQDKWQEWNGEFRDDIRRFVKGDQGTLTKLGERLTGSLDLYTVGDRPAGQSINFVTCHDGFTLHDLVSYNEKHNDENNLMNRDGTDANLSWNCGVEGVTGDAAVDALRDRQIRNFFVLTLLSVGTPMLLMGDEVQQTQLGNNNAYCQNNELSWLDWNLCSIESETFQFVQQLIHLRLNFSQDETGQELTLEEFQKQAHFVWHGVAIGKPDWGNDSHSLAFTMRGLRSGRAVYMAINAYWQPLDFELPHIADRASNRWRRIIDTSLPHSTTIAAPGKEINVDGLEYRVNPRSIVLLICGYRA